MFDGFAKSLKSSVLVIPAKAGIHLSMLWTPAFAGVTVIGTFYEFINVWIFEFWSLEFVCYLGFAI